MSVFIDTGPFISYYSKRDENHELSKLIFTEIEKGVYGDAVTSDYILTETMNFLFKKAGRDQALVAGKKIIENYPILHVDNILFQESWKKFNVVHPFSLTDCTNLVLAEHYGFDNVFTFDSAFKQFVKVIGAK
ncbi:type II toxin-antitoxin system VapC family toxin [Candidatus Micrarchaeota archaeon]|nr:type II toxin-antitoxin system VapC family toxin [Candidatus Micrarchaeota archaeon]